jgi:hypothetical protein
MNVKELKEYLKDVPDDTEIIMVSPYTQSKFNTFFEYDKLQIDNVEYCEEIKELRISPC